MLPQNVEPSKCEYEFAVSENVLWDGFFGIQVDLTFTKQATKGSEKRQKKQEQSELQQENKRLSEENYRLRMENDYLKKLNALIQKREKPE